MPKPVPASSTKDGSPLPTGPDPVQAPILTTSDWPQVPGYTILAELGHGGMGVVYKARQHALDRFVALKVIRKDRLANPDAVRRFRREVQAAARLSHPHLVIVYHADQVADTHYFSMEYIDGLTLQRLVEDSGPLPVALACEYVRQAALGLQHASERGLVHRDIKPANLIVTRGKDAGGAYASPLTQPLTLLKILDMGLARLHQPLGRDDPASSILTEQGAFIGTLDYIAPEQAHDPRKSDIRADLYSLGCTFYFMLTGQVPFPGGTLLDKLDRHRWTEPELVHKVRADVSIDVSAVVHKLLAKKPEDRFATPVELATALFPLSQGPFTMSSGPVIVPLDLATDGTLIIQPSSAGSAEDPELEYQRLKQEAEEELGRGNFSSARRLVAALLRLKPGNLEALAARAAIDKYAAPPDIVGEIRRFQGHSDIVTGVAFSTDGARAASVSRDGTLRIWDLDYDQPLRTIEAHQDGGTCLVGVWDEPLIISGGQDRLVRIWDTLTGEEVRRLEGHRERVWTVAVLPQKRLILSAGGALGRKKDNALRLWNMDTGRELARFVGHTDQVNSVAFAADGNSCVSASSDDTLRVWDLNSGKTIHTLTGHVGSICSVAYTPDGGSLLYGGESARLLALSDAGETCLLFQHPEEVLALAFATDGSRFVTGCADNMVRLWEIASGRAGRQEKSMLLGVQTVVRVWDPGSGGEPHQFEGHAGRVTCVAVSPDGRRAISGSADRSVRVWGLPERE